MYILTKHGDQLFYSNTRYVYILVLILCRSIPSHNCLRKQVYIVLGGKHCRIQKFEINARVKLLKAIATYIYKFVSINIFHYNYGIALHVVAKGLYFMASFPTYALPVSLSDASALFSRVDSSQSRSFNNSNARHSQCVMLDNVVVCSCWALTVTIENQS